MKKTLLKIAAATIIMGGAFSTTAVEHTDDTSAKTQISYKDQYVFETFKITKINKKHTKIWGDITSSSSGMMGNEGIYLDKSYYKKFNKINKKLKKGDTILVIYSYDDYYQTVWDNILDIKIMK